MQEQENNQGNWYDFMSKDEWVVFMNILRIATFILLGVIIYVLISEIEAVKMMAYDPCQICMNKSGATCYLLEPRF